MSELFFKAYLVMVFPEGRYEIYGRGYNLISESAELGKSVLKSLKTISTWKNYSSPLNRVKGDGFWVEQKGQKL